MSPATQSERKFFAAIGILALTLAGSVGLRVTPAALFGAYPCATAEQAASAGATLASLEAQVASTTKTVEKSRGKINRVDRLLAAVNAAESRAAAASSTLASASSTLAAAETALAQASSGATRSQLQALKATVTRAATSYKTASAAADRARKHLAAERETYERERVAIAYVLGLRDELGRLDAALAEARADHEWALANQCDDEVSVVATLVSASSSVAAGGDPHLADVGFYELTFHLEAFGDDAWVLGETPATQTSDGRQFHVVPENFSARYGTSTFDLVSPPRSDDSWLTFHLPEGDRRTFKLTVPVENGGDACAPAALALDWVRWMELPYGKDSDSIFLRLDPNEFKTQELLLCGQPTYIDSDFVDSSAAVDFVADEPGEADVARFSVTFEVTAVGDDMYIPKQPTMSSSSPLGSGVSWWFGDSTTGAANLAGAAVSASGSTIGDTSTMFKIADGNTRQFELTVMLEALGDGFVGIGINGIRWTTDPDDATPDNFHGVAPEEFATPMVRVNVI